MFNPKLFASTLEQLKIRRSLELIKDYKVNDNHKNHAFINSLLDNKIHISNYDFISACISLRNFELAKDFIKAGVEFTSDNYNFVINAKLNEEEILDLFEVSIKQDKIDLNEVKFYTIATNNNQQNVACALIKAGCRINPFDINQNIIKDHSIIIAKLASEQVHLNNLGIDFILTAILNKRRHLILNLIDSNLNFTKKHYNQACLEKFKELEILEILDYAIKNNNIDLQANDFFSLATHYNHQAIEQKLIQIKAFINPRSINEIVNKNHIETIKMLIEQEINLLQIGFDFLMSAISLKNLEISKLLIRGRLQFNRSHYLQAVKQDFKELEILELINLAIISKNIDLSTMSLFNLASNYHHEEIACRLIYAGIHVSASIIYDEIRNDHTKIIKVLIAENDEIHDNSYDFILTAILAKNFEILKLMLKTKLEFKKKHLELAIKNFSSIEIKELQKLIP